ncbi:unnamed protein product [Sphenostylis stenocarpa]|uniref:Uncharacterized protein n=1 Tax=Sphenostylis stenocarpa TaxID=92480 RepID=A0AA86SDC3_9FABA|nr:unnamed protein product [Sphenostylis stenocarpa]
MFIGSGFSSSSTAEEVTEGIDGTTLTAIVTGATSAIGAEAWCPCNYGVRNLIAAKDIKEAILEKTPAAKVDYMELDLSSMASVRNFASEFISSGLPLNILMNFCNPFHSDEGVDITANSLHPGAVVTNIFRHTSVLAAIFISIEGAATTCYVALHPQVREISGHYFEDCNVSTTNSKARDLDLAKKLWDFSFNLIK